MLRYSRRGNAPQAACIGASARWRSIASVLLLVAAAAASATAAAVDFSAVAPMLTERYLHAATLLPNGQVLVVGGRSSSTVLASSEIYDPLADTWRMAPDMSRRRSYHTATLLPNGRVLITGGNGESGFGNALSSVELYDTLAGGLGSRASLGQERWGHTATLLSNGKVLVVGGRDNGEDTLATAELYDPASDSWRRAASLPVGRAFHSATLLRNGKVLIAGGADANGPKPTSYLYDPATDSWASTGDLHGPHRDHAATTLANGKVFLVGGPFTGAFQLAELYDPTSGTWDGIGAVPARARPTATLLRSGAVLVVGGSTERGSSNTGELYAFVDAPGARPVDVVEFYHAALDHYFITWIASEIATLDAGTTITGWTRTGFGFSTFVTMQTGTSPVCRYYIPPLLGNSHFFGRGTQECDATGLANPSFVLEDPAFMQLFLPYLGACAGGTTPIYRVFSNRADANHRYTTSLALRDAMVALGWTAEGDGPDRVVMCAPQMSDDGGVQMTPQDLARCSSQRAVDCLSPSG